MKTKRVLTVICLLAGGWSVYAQGLIDMSDYGGIQVFHGQSASASTTMVSYGGFTGYEEMGQTSNAYCAYAHGNTIYANDTVLGPGYSVGLLAAPGANVPLGSLIPVAGTPITSWYNFGNPDTGLDGFWNTSALSYVIPNAQPGGTATIAVAVWASNGDKGPAASLHDAQVDGYEWGISRTGNVPSLGGNQFTPPSAVWYLVSFSTAVNVTPVPEPDVLILGLLGLSIGLPHFRRRKNNPRECQP